MSELVKAECKGGIVSIEGLAVNDVEILTEGIDQSDGILFLHKDKAFYLTSNATKLKEVIESLSDIADQLVQVINSIGAGMTGITTAPPPTLQNDLAQITTLSNNLKVLKDNLK